MKLAIVLVDRKLSQKQSILASTVQKNEAFLREKGGSSGHSGRLDIHSG